MLHAVLLARTFFLSSAENGPRAKLSCLGGEPSQQAWETSLFPWLLLSGCWVLWLVGEGWNVCISVQGRREKPGPLKQECGCPLESCKGSLDEHKGPSEDDEKVVRKLDYVSGCTIL